MHHPKRAASGSPPGGSSGPAAAASTGVVYGCGRVHWNRTHVNRARGRSSSRRQILKPRRPPLRGGSPGRPAAASRAPCGCCLAASRAPGLPCLGVASHSSVTAAFRASAAHRCSDVTACNPWSVSNAAMRRRASVGQNFGCPALPVSAPHSGLQKESSTAPEESPCQEMKACGRFGWR